MILALFKWLQDIPMLAFIRESGLTYPIIMATHLACIAVFGGMILLTDLRLLGVTLKSYTITEVVRGLRPWKHIGGTIMIGCGILLGGSKAPEYYPNPYFWTKLILLGLILVHGIVFRPTVYTKTEEIDKLPVIPGRVKAAAALSLVLWTGVLCMGRLIGYYEPAKPTITSRY